MATDAFGGHSMKEQVVNSIVNVHDRYINLLSVKKRWLKLGASYGLRRHQIAAGGRANFHYS